MSQPFVSVCIITKNEEKNLLKTLESVIKQTYNKESFEIIVVDGDSKDKTIAWADALLTQAGVKHLIVNEKEYPNKRGGYEYGHSFARNVAVDLVSEKSKYVLQIDADCRAAPDRIQKLVDKMENEGQSKNIAGAWWARLVETKEKISKFELMLNYYFCSPIMTLWNPAFCERQGLKYISSIAGYNSIYKTSLIKKYRFNTKYATFFDDIELNYRLEKDGFLFLYCPEAKIWHRLEENFSQFLQHLQTYGGGAAKMTKCYHTIPRLYVVFSLGYILYTIALYPLLLLSISFLLPYGMVFVLAILVFVENIKKTKSLISLYVFPLVFLHPLMYGWGFIKEIVKK